MSLPMRLAPPFYRFLLAGSLFYGAFAAAPAAAQQMGQGEANITAQADVRISMESGPATNSAKLSEIGGVIGAKMGAVRTCYQEVTEARPTVQGEIRLLVDLARGGSVSMREDGVEDRALSRCVLRAMRAANLRSVRPPGAAFLVLTFTNTAAEGVATTRERRAAEGAVPVTRSSEGRLEATGRSGSGEVRFRAVGGEGATEEQVAALQRSIREAIPILLDCRRKASRNHSPEGEITLRVTVNGRGKGRIRMRESSVRDPRGGRCLTRFLGRQPFEAAARGTHDVVVTFSAAEPTHPRREN